ncbi:DUF1326 domain-containing protein [Halomonas icarae]|uniref:DUF1326 domain-containing protein n=1 Tax=Halomonas icarae TaxID=2691040 RepID=A0A7X4VXR1_9GAMM|nr:DUF1326 domain-containing protein [Halomonas icarae]MDR5902165.1 DUF1326 domain-containing protein [Halomonas icarae]NAW11975.1 DUF1326 domain-containing protein [Halomonas icarae]
MTVQWQVEGTYFEACTCKGACPCLFAGDPTEGTCDALVAWHIDRGSMGNIHLDGLNLAMALHAPGNMTAGGWKVVVYIDANASQQQHDALKTIFGGNAGGHPATLAGFVGEILGVESTPMRYDIENRHHRLEVGETARASLNAISGQNEGQVTISGHPVAVAPGNTGTVAQSENVSHSGYGLDWSFGGRFAFYSPFQYQAA